MDRIQRGSMDVLGLAVSTAKLRLEVDPRTGAITTVDNTARGLRLVSRRPARAPFRLHLVEVGPVDHFDEFRADRIGDGLRLSWSTRHGVTITSDVMGRGDDLVMTVRADNLGPVTIDRVDYPIVAGIGRLAGPGRDSLVHTHGTGILFNDPLDLLEADPDNRRRLTESPHPTGFSGATMQFLAYYGRGLGGFMLATEDGGRSLKWLNVAREDDGLTASVGHKAPFARHGEGFSPGYPVVIAPLTEGTWYEAGDRYRSWAFGQSWAASSKPGGWLREKVGLATFGINARHDRSPWLDAFHRMAGTPVLHVLGPNWAASGQDYRGSLPRKLEDWFPAAFDASNQRTIKQNGDFWAPFELDLLCPDPIGPTDLSTDLRLIPNERESGQSDPGIVRFPIMCPGTKAWRNLHVARDKRLASQYGADATYYDISVNNVLLQCLAQGHEHAARAGDEIGAAFETMFRDTSAAMADARGEHVPAGAETISEAFVETFDFFQARSEAWPHASFEMEPFRDWMLDGRAEKIPLFTYVYQERAPLRLDGWAKLSAESGDLFYWVAAQVVLNGGLLELNYEFSPLEDLDGHSDDATQHYFDFQPRRYSIDESKAAFVGEVARTRTGPANQFLARGALLPAPKVEAPDVRLWSYAYNMPKDWPLYERRDEMTVPSALASAWRLEERTAWLVANLLPHEQLVLVDDRPISVPGRGIRVVEH